MPLEHDGNAAGAEPSVAAGQLHKEPGGIAAGQRPGKRGRRRLLRFGLFVLVALVCLYLFRVPLLRRTANFLIVDEPLSAADYVLVVDGDGRFRQAASLLHARFASQVLLIEAKPERLQRLGLVPSPVDEARRELKALALPDGCLSVIPGKAHTDWDRARCLRDWLGQHPQVKLALLCDELGSRRLRHILDQVLGGERSRQIHLRPLPPRWLEGIDWWQQREGVLAVGQAYLRLGYVWLWAEGAQDSWREWDPEEYAETLR